MLLPGTAGEKGAADNVAGDPGLCNDALRRPAPGRQPHASHRSQIGSRSQPERPGSRSDPQIDPDSDCGHDNSTPTDRLS